MWRGRRWGSLLAVGWGVVWGRGMVVEVSRGDGCGCGALLLPPRGEVYLHRSRHVGEFLEPQESGYPKPNQDQEIDRHRECEGKRGSLPVFAESEIGPSSPYRFILVRRPAY